MKLQFYCHTAPDHSNPFPEDGCEVLLSVSIIRDSDGRFTPISQTGEGFMDMVDTIIANPRIKKVTLLNTAYLQRYRKVLELRMQGVQLEIAEEQAGDLVLEDGEAWEKENKAAIDKLKSRYGENFVQLSWREVLGRKFFQERLSSVNACYYSGLPLQNLPIGIKQFRKAMKGLVDIFIEQLSGVLREKLTSGILGRKIIGGYMCKIAVEECVARTLLRFPREVYRGALNVPAIILGKAYDFSDNMQFVTIGDEGEIKHAMEVVGQLSPNGSPKEASSESRAPVLKLSIPLPPKVAAVQRGSSDDPKVASSAPMAVAAASVSMLPPPPSPPMSVPKCDQEPQESSTQLLGSAPSGLFLSEQRMQSFGSAVPQSSFSAPKGSVCCQRLYMPRAVDVSRSPIARVNLPQGVYIDLYDDPKCTACAARFLKDLGFFGQSGVVVNKKPEKPQPPIKFAQP